MPYMVQVDGLGLGQTETAAVGQQPLHKIIIVIGKSGKILVVSTNGEKFITVNGHQEGKTGV